MSKQTHFPSAELIRRVSENDRPDRLESIVGISFGDRILQKYIDLHGNQDVQKGGKIYRDKRDEIVLPMHKPICIG